MRDENFFLNEHQQNNEKSANQKVKNDKIKCESQTMMKYRKKEQNLNKMKKIKSDNQDKVFKDRERQLLAIDFKNRRSTEQK